MYSIAVTAADYDNDGFVDLLVTGYGRAMLYHNDGHGHFVDVTEKAGIKVDGWAISSTWLDYDKDGCVDLFVGRYVKFDPAYRAYYAADNYPGPLDYEGTTNKLFHNNCDGTFTDVSDKSGISQFVGRTMGVTAADYDFDNDGLLDILIFHGGLIHLIPQEHTVFKGLGNGHFADVSQDAGSVLSTRTTARGACFADYDNDGKVDAFLVNLGGKGTLVHNVSTNTGHWLALKLKGSKSNRDGIGAKVEVFAGGKRWTAERVAGSGYLSQDDGRMHFGLGSAASVDKVIVRWPSGVEQTIEKQGVDRVLTVEEPR
jgi:hypothetical protein